MTMTVQIMKYIREHSIVYELDFHIAEKINIDFVYLNFIVNRIQFILDSNATYIYIAKKLILAK